MQQPFLRIEIIMMKITEFWDGINLGNNHREAVLEMKFEKQECERLYEVYKKNHNVFFEEVFFFFFTAFSPKNCKNIFFFCA